MTSYHENTNEVCPSIVPKLSCYTAVSRTWAGLSIPICCTRVAQFVGQGCSSQCELHHPLGQKPALDRVVVAVIGNDPFQHGARRSLNVDRIVGIRPRGTVGVEKGFWFTTAPKK